MSELPADLRYSKTHEWVRDEGNGIVTVGITDHAQELLGDLVFVELPEVGTSVEAEGECAVVESVKAASDIYSPVTGEIVEVNQNLADAPESINEDAYGAGWIFRLKMAATADLSSLLDADGYRKIAEAEEG